MYKQLTSEQRSQIFVLLQKKTSRKEIAELVKISQSTLSRELKCNSTAKGHYLWKQAQEKSEERRRRTTSNSKKDEIIIWEALEYLRRDQWSPMQISGLWHLMAKESPMNSSINMYGRTKVGNSKRTAAIR